MPINVDCLTHPERHPHYFTLKDTLIEGVVHIYNPSTWEADQEDSELVASLGCIARSCLSPKNK
jgi:hypothetical protein